MRCNVVRTVAHERATVKVIPDGVSRLNSSRGEHVHRFVARDLARGLGARSGAPWRYVSGYFREVVGAPDASHRCGAGGYLGLPTKLRRWGVLRRISSRVVDE
jgi:hypothetical protein